MVGYLPFKVLLISAVATPDTCEFYCPLYMTCDNLNLIANVTHCTLLYAVDLLVLLLWYSTLSLLRNLCHVAGSAINYATQSGQPPQFGALLLLLSLLVCDGLAIAVCSQLFDTWSMFLLLTADGIILCNNVMMHIFRYSIATMEEKHRDTMTQLEESIAAIQSRRREVDVTDTAGVQSLEEESRLRDLNAEAKEVHGETFGLVNTFSQLCRQLEERFVSEFVRCLLISPYTELHFMNAATCIAFSKK